MPVFAIAELCLLQEKKESWMAAVAHGCAARGSGWRKQLWADQSHKKQSFSGVDCSRSVLKHIVRQYRVRISSENKLMFMNENKVFFPPV